MYHCVCVTVCPQVLSCLPLLPQNLARMHEKNTWHVRVNYCPSRQVFIGLTTAPEHAIGTMNIAKVWQWHPVLLVCVLCVVWCVVCK